MKLIANGVNLQTFTHNKQIYSCSIFKIFDIDHFFHFRIGRWCNQSPEHFKFRIHPIRTYFHICLQLIIQKLYYREYGWAKCSSIVARKFVVHIQNWVNNGFNGRYFLFRLFSTERTNKKSETLRFSKCSVHQFYWFKVQQKTKWKKRNKLIPIRNELYLHNEKN